MAELNIHLSPNIFIYHRVYTRIQHVIARVGGLANIISMVFIYIARIFSVTKRDELLLNEIFDFNLNINSKSLTNTEKIKSIVNDNFQKVNVSLKVNVSVPEREHSPDIKPNFPEIEAEECKKNFSFKNTNTNLGTVSEMKTFKQKNSIYYPEVETNVKKDMSVDGFILTRKDEIVDRSKSIKKAEEVISKIESRTRDEGLKFSFCEILISNIFCCNFLLSKSLMKKKKLYEKGNSILEQYLDLPKLISILEEFDKFKIVLLNPKQLALFKFISKELISLNEEDSKNHQMTFFKMMQKDKMGLANLIVEEIHQLKQSNINDDVDKKLYNLLNEEFKF